MPRILTALDGLQIATPSAPASGHNLVYFKSDGRLYLEDSSGNEYPLVRRRVASVASSATPTINADITEVFKITALAAAITSMTTNLSGTPVDGQTLIIDILDNGTARAITWGASFEASTVALPTTTVISTLLTVGFRWNTATSKWRCVAVA